MNGRHYTCDYKMRDRLLFYFQLSFIFVVYFQSVKVSSKKYSLLAQFEVENKLI